MLEHFGCYQKQDMGNGCVEGCDTFSVQGQKSLQKSTFECGLKNAIAWTCMN